MTSANFSYRDERGRPHRETEFAAEVVVEREREPSPEPQITVGLQTTKLPYNEWSNLRSRIANIGPVNVSDLEITLSGRIMADQRGASIKVDELRAGNSADVSFFVRGQETGSQVPVYFDIAYTYCSRRYRVATTQSVAVVSGLLTPMIVVAESDQPIVRILFLASNPIDTRPLRLDEEMREIQGTIRAGKSRDNIDFRERVAVRPSDISQALLDYEPRIVHFAGHGGGTDGSLAVEDEHGAAHIIPVEAMVRLFQVAGRGVECVLVNVCNTELLASAMSPLVPYVIGMRQPVGDRSAIRFSIGFYQALAAGRPIEDAFDLGVAQLAMMPIGPDQSAPLFLRRAR
jgi:hypothetical protein